MRGWIFRKRDHGKIVFLDLRGEDGKIYQVVAKEEVIGKDKLEKIKKLPLESAIEVFGELIKTEKAPEGYEIKLKDFKVFSFSEEYPLAPKYHSPDVILKYRHLSIRFPKYIKIFKFRAKILKYLREFLESKGFVEVHVPIIQKSACEGGATLFEINFYDNKAYLNQSGQLYLEALIFALGKVYTIDPCFRAEKSRTRRHLSEFWQLEAEAAWYSNEKMMDLEEEMIKYAISKVIDSEEIKYFRKDKKVLEKTIEEKWERIKYEEVIEYLQKKGYKIEFGDDLGADEERILTLEYETPIFVTHYPKEIKAFYMKWDPKDTRVVLNHDLLAPEGYGEIIGGSERETDVNKLIERIKAEGFDEKDYWWYLDLRKYGSVQHSGFGLGIERFVMWLLKLDHIRETIPFPRMYRREEFI